MNKLPREVLHYLVFILPEVLPEADADMAIREMFLRDLGGV